MRLLADRMCKTQPKRVQVVFDSRSRFYPAHFEHGDASAVSVLYPAHESPGNTSALELHLRALLPNVPAMQRAIAQQATGFQYSVRDHDEDDSSVGPDALDLALWRIFTSASSSSHQPGHK